MGYVLNWKNRFIRGTSPITGDTDCSTPIVYLDQEAPNRIIYNWTGAQFTRLLSALKTGADLMFPEVANDILWDLLQGVHCPPELDPEESGCTEYPPSAPFVTYFPDNPYLSGDTSAGWNKEAWFLWPQFDSLFPDWFDNWLNGIISSLTGYQATDVLFNIESIPINPIDAWLNGGGILPKIEIRFSGTGVVEITLLSFPLGGKAIVELDSEPNALDILTGGILDPSAFMLELNRDIINFPPDEHPEIIFELNVETAGDHVLYIVFIPILDDNLLPIGFGGGIRSVELCGFEELPMAGIEGLVFEDCTLKTVIGGVKTPVVGWEDWLDCIEHPEGGGGGGGGGGASEAYLGHYRVTANKTTNSTSFVDIDSTNIKQDITLANAAKVVAAFFIPQVRKDTAQTGTFRLTDGTTGGDELVIPVRPAGEGESIWVLGEWDLAAGSYTLRPQYKSSNSNVIAVLADNEVSWQVMVFDDIEASFVQDIRIENGELQKLIGGVWYDVVDSFADIIANLQSQITSVQATANSALSQAAAAQTTANNAATVNAVQTSQINALNSLTAMHTSQIADHEERIDILEDANIGDLSEIIQDIEALENSVTGIIQVNIAQNDRLDELEAWQALTDIALQVSADFIANMPTPIVKHEASFIDSVPLNLNLELGTFESGFGVRSENDGGVQTVRISQATSHNNAHKIWLVRVEFVLIDTPTTNDFGGGFGGVNPSYDASMKVFDTGVTYRLYIFDFQLSDISEPTVELRYLNASSDEFYLTKIEMFAYEANVYP